MGKFELKVVAVHTNYGGKFSLDSLGLGSLIALRMDF